MNCRATAIKRMKAYGNVFRQFGAKEKTSGTREKLAALQSQGDCVFQPRVVPQSGKLPGVPGRLDFNPNGVVSLFRRRAATPLGLFAFGHTFPRVARPSRLRFATARHAQPWALNRNPFGIHLKDFRKASGLAAISANDAMIRRPALFC